MTATDASAPTSSATCWRQGVAPTRKPVLRSLLVAPALAAAMQTTPPTVSATAGQVPPVQPSSTKIRQVIISVAIAIPEMGFDELPMRPVMRLETVTKMNPKITISTEANALATARPGFTLNVIGSRTIPDGRYYYNSGAHQLEWKVQPGIGSQQMPAPQAILMTTVINGILSQNLQWGLVLFGVFIVIVIELLGVRSLPFATGSYLPISTTAAIFAGGVVRWLVERKSNAAPASESDVSSGSLMASGLIAGGALAGLLVVVPMDSWRNHLDELARAAHVTLPYEWGDFGAHYWPAIQQNDLIALALFVVLAGVLYRVAKKPLETT